jgi:hypothetical protein
MWACFLRNQPVLARNPARTASHTINFIGESEDVGSSVSAARRQTGVELGKTLAGSPAAHSIPRHSALATTLSEPEVAFIAAIGFYACLTL